MSVASAAIPLETQAARALRALVPPGATCVVAVSGGPDSMALLDLLHLGAADHACELVVGHVDHGIHRESAAVADLVRTAATERGLACHVRTLGLSTETSETRARAGRQAALREIAADAGAGAVLLAHHADDQAETVLLRLLRGSGPAGLAGMAARHGPWIRPLLGLRRATLLAHLQSRGIAAWTDPANSDPRHLRSWLRTAVLPVLAAHLGDVTTRLNQSAAHAASARRAWNQVPELLGGLDVESSDRGISVAAPVLQGYRSSLRHAVLAALGRRIGVRLGRRRLAAVDRLLGSQSGGAVTLEGAVQAELAFGRLTFHKRRDAGPAPMPLVCGERTVIADWQFTVSAVSAIAVDRRGSTTDLVPGRYLARPWRAGDRIRPLGGTGSRAVAVEFREARVSPARRKTWPVVVTGDDATIVWVPGICRADAGVPAEGEEAWRVECSVS